MTPAMARVEGDFQTVWKDICERLQAGQRIRARSLGGDIPDASFTVVRVELDRVVVEDGEPHGERSILREEFEQGLLVWPKYCAGAIATGVLQHAALRLRYVFAIFRVL